MDAQELRIGNWVLFCKECEPFEVEADDIAKTAYGSFEYHPIPLTEEWLVKFGFEDNNSYFCSSEFKDFRLSWSIRVVKTNERRHFYLDDNFPEVFQVKIDYVHELQNLYFALTGEELEIKE